MDFDFSIEGVEKKTNELKNDVLELGYRILMIMDENKKLPEAQRKEITPDMIEEQKYKKGQYTFFSQMLKEMKKKSPAGKSDLSDISRNISEMKNTLGSIQQKLP